MNDVLKRIGSFFCGILGVMFFIYPLEGIFNYFMDSNHPIKNIPFALVSLAIGSFLLRIAFKKTSTKQVNDTTFHSYGSPITDEEIPYLIQSGYEKAILAEKESTNPKFHRTEREENLAFNFIKKYENELNNLIDNFENLYNDALKTDNQSQRIELLNLSLIAFEKAKKFAYSKGKGGTIYFQDMYECLHNSQTNCFSYADLIQNRIDSEIQERDVIIPGILQIVQENDGILQKNIYEKLPSVSKSDIQKVIKKLESKNIITRIKKSNSYELHISSGI